MRASVYFSFSLFALVLGFCAIVYPQSSFAKTVRYELVITQTPLNMSGKKTVDFALTVNGGIPAPTLEFREGDDAEITVRNELKNSHEDVSIHWHGILLPPLEDGVPFVNTPPIYPGKSRVFRFPIRQHGTYWYHSHTMLQEQKGVYGAIVIHPNKKTLPAEKEAVVVLSDWSDENADQILRNLKKDGDYYLYKKNTLRSYFDAARQGKLGNHFMNEWTRMGGMDLSDVGYDAFLINGRRDSQLLAAKAGETIRLRIINAAASSFFHVSVGKLPMTVVAADGVDVQPTTVDELFMGMAETYDVLLTLPRQNNYELRATAQDGTGHASAFIGSGEKIWAREVPKPDPYSTMDHSQMADGGKHHASLNSSTHGHDKMAHTEHKNVHEMPAAPHDPKIKKNPARKMLTMDHAPTQHSSHAAKMDHTHHSKTHHDAKTPESSSPLHHAPSHVPSHTHSDATPMSPHSFDPINSMSVEKLKAIDPVKFPKNAKVHKLKLVLNGDMRRYVWHINGKTIQQDRLLHVNPGEVVQITYQNNSMMHHPMHLHGHFFRVLTTNGTYSPWKHTVDVPPMSSRTIEFYTDEVGQWMLHCHNLYHMDTGMARVVRYQNFTPSEAMAKHDKHDHHRKDPWYPAAKAGIFSNHVQGSFKFAQSWNEISGRLEATKIRGKFVDLNFDSNWDREGDLFFHRWFGNWTNLIFGGTLYAEKVHAVVGIGYFLPMMIQTQVFLNHKGQLRIDVEREFRWTRSLVSDFDLTWRPGRQGDEEESVEFQLSLMYAPQWAWSAGLMLSSESWGVGMEYKF